MRAGLEPAQAMIGHIILSSCREGPEYVAAVAHGCQGSVPAGFHLSGIPAGRRGKFQHFKMAQPGPAQGLVEPPAGAASFGDPDDPVRGICEDRPVQSGKALLRDFGLPCLGNLKIPPWPEAFGDDVLRAGGEPFPDIGRGDDEVPAVRVLAPDHDMGVGVACIVVIDGQPVEACAEIRFHLGHERAGGLLQVTQAASVFRRHDDAELMPVLFAARGEPVRIRHGALPAIEFAA